MGKINFRCDSCGHFISARDFDHGAVRRELKLEDFNNEGDIETLCIKCNKYPDEAS